MDLLDIVPIGVVIAAIIFGSLGLYLLLRYRVVHSMADPNIINFFQVTFTFFVLLFLGDILIVDLIGFAVFFGLLIKFHGSTKKRIPIISQEDWVAFSKVFAVVLFVLNVYLLEKKGFLLLMGDIGNARVEFYQSWGVFKRFNEIGVGLTSITAAILWHNKHQKQAIAMALFSVYLALTLGSRGGLLAILLAYGAYLHFAPRKISNKNILLVGALLGCSSLGIFFIMFGPKFMGAFAYRVVGFSDGPVYYFSDHMYRYSDYSPMYPFDDLLIDLRLKPRYGEIPLGRFINLHHFGEDTPLFGPNPQIFVESHAAFHWLSILWYVVVAGVFIYLRRRATPYSFFLGCYIAGPLLIDSQLAGSQLFTIMLVLSLLGMFLAGRGILRGACVGVSRRMAEI